MPLTVLKLLSHDDFKSGEALSLQLGLSRASIHNLVERAREMGVVIHAVRGRGYRLAEPYSWLDSSRLQNSLSSQGFTLQVHDHLLSTNSHLLAISQGEVSHKLVAVAEIQTGGRGRRGRTWLAQVGGGLTFSVSWRFHRPLSALSGLSLAVGLAMVRVLHAMGVHAARLKWPNDILIGDAKLAGILIETQGDMLGDALAVIGIGLNVRVNQGMREAVEQPLACLAEALGDMPDRNEVLLAILKELDVVLQGFDQHGFEPYCTEWESWHAWQGRDVRILGMGQVVLEGRAEGVDPSGALRVHTQDGMRLSHSGEVSLRLRGAT